MTESGKTQPFVLGVTGNIACGKSAVLQMLAELGAETIDADKVYHALIEPDCPLWQSIIHHFGDALLSADRQIDRRKLGALVFSDSAALAELERLTHPAIRVAILHRIAETSAPVVAIDAVKLIESGFDQFCDRVWLVTCTLDEQRTRLMRRNGLTLEEADRRISAQPPLALKIDRADLIIDNSGSLEATTAQVLRAWQHLPIDNGAGHSSHHRTA
jgi:dephospho-CoA kinase